MKHLDILIALIATAVILLITSAIICSHREHMKKLDIELREIEKSFEPSAILKTKKGLW